MTVNGNTDRQRSGKMSKNIENAILLDTYGSMLTEKQYDTLSLYYDEDLSLSEIAENMGITRQGVHKCIRTSEEYLTQLEETLGGLRVIKAFVAEDKMQARFNNVTEAVKKKTGRVATRQALAHPMSEFLGTVLIAIVLGFGGVIILSEKAWFDAPTFIFYMVILYSVINPLKDFAKAGYNIPKGMASMERIEAILNSESTVKEKADAKLTDGFNDSITFEHVDFAYSPDRKILDDISLTVKKGSTVAIVGESGAGKSTLVDLIPRFYDVSGGCIRIDGTDIRDLKIHSLRSLMGNVNQEPILFNDTIFNNIAFGLKLKTIPDGTTYTDRKGRTFDNMRKYTKAEIAEKDEGFLP